MSEVRLGFVTGQMFDLTSQHRVVQRKIFQQLLNG